MRKVLMMPCRSSLEPFGMAQRDQMAFTEGHRVKAFPISPSDRQQTVNIVNHVYKEGAWV